MREHTVKVRLKPFSVPLFVVAEASLKSREDGFKEAPQFHISEIDRDVLIEMCDDFKKELLKKAGYGS